MPHQEPTVGSGAALFRSLNQPEAQFSFADEVITPIDPNAEQAELVRQIDIQTASQAAGKRAGEAQDVDRARRIKALGEVEDFEAGGGAAGELFRAEQAEQRRNLEPGEAGLFLRSAQVQQPQGFVGPAQGFVQPRPGRVVTQTPFRQGTLEDIEGGIEKQFAGQQLAETQAATASAAHAGFLQKLSEDMKGFENEQAASRANRDQQVEEDMNRMRQAVTAIKAGKIDPQRFYRDRSTGAKILGAIGGFFGGIASGLTGTPNQFLQQLNKWHDADIQAQIQDIGSKASAFKAQSGIFGTMMNMFNDRDQAITASKIALLERARVDMQSMAAGSQSEQAKAKILESQGLMEQQLGELAANFQKQSRRVKVGGGLTVEEKARNEAARTFLIERAKAGGKAAGAPLGGVSGDPATIQKVSDVLVREKIPGLSVDIQNVERLIKPFSDESIEGLGFFERAIPGPALGLLSELGSESAQKKVETRQAFQGMINTLIRINAGLNQTVSEEVRTLKQIEGAKDTQSLKRSARDLIEKYNRKINTITAPLGGASSPAGQQILQVSGIGAATSPALDFAPPV